MFKPLLTYGGQLLTATVLTSLSFHLLYARRDAAELRRRFTARISILESLTSRLRQGESIESSEIDRLLRLSRKLHQHQMDDLGDSIYGDDQKISWKEMFLGTARST